MTQLNTSSAYNKTLKAVSNIDNIETLKNFKSFKVMKRTTSSPSNFDSFFVVHKSSLNFNDRVEIFACKTCNKISVLTQTCSC